MTSGAAKRMREARHRAGMSVRQVAEEIQERTGRDVPTKTLSRMETGDISLKVDIVWEVARVLGVDPFELAQFDADIDGMKKSIFGEPALNVRVTTNGWFWPEIPLTRTAMRFLGEWLIGHAENDDNWRGAR